MFEVNIHGYFLRQTLSGTDKCPPKKVYALNDGRKDVAMITIFETWCEVKLYRDGKLERGNFTCTDAKDYVPQVYETQRYDFVEFVKEVINDYVINAVKQFQ